MNALDNNFSQMLRDELDKLYRDAQISLATPATNELSTSIHEIGVLRGYMKCAVEVYDICSEITRKLSEPEKKA